LKYLLGLICSKVMAFYFLNTHSDRKITFPKIKGYQIEQLPIKIIDFEFYDEQERHNWMLKLVDTMLDLHKQLQAARTETDKHQIQTRIEHTDHQIDRLVYELYGLTEEEIKIIEETMVK
jgi:hypothetical protein